jgi:hypothetical protein
MDYKNAKIYKIVCNITGEVYIGSTTSTLVKRLHIHKKKQGCSSKQIIERGNYVIVLVEEYPCENKQQLLMRERYWFDIIPNINKIRPYTSKEEKKQYIKEYKIIHKEEILEKSRTYYNLNKEALNYKNRIKYHQDKLSI